MGSKKEKTGAEVEDGLAGTSKGGWKTILAGGEGRVEPGKLVAILGPSGEYLEAWVEEIDSAD